MQGRRAENARGLVDAGAWIGRLTDLSRAIDHAGDLAAGGAGRVILNVIGNGADNIGEPAAPARARLLAAGATVYGVVLGGDAAVVDYYRSDVAGGAGSFVIAASGAEGLWRRCGGSSSWTCSRRSTGREGEWSG